MRKCNFYFAILIFSNAVFGQATNPPAPPVAPVAPVAPVPSAQMPQMPSIAAPVSGSNFYTPGENYKNPAEKKNSQSPQNKKEDSSQKNSSLDEAVLNAALSDFAGNVSAWDMLQLSERGVLQNLSSLNKNFSSAEKLNGQKILSQILQEIQEIKNAQKISEPPAVQEAKNLPPKILRFSLGSQNVECSQVFFSDRENDGSFLLTGDVKTIFEGQTISETFYLLFSASGTQGSKPLYSVTPTIFQSAAASTPLANFCSQKNLTATRAGNLVTLFGVVNGSNFDLLLDIGSPR